MSLMEKFADPNMIGSLSGSDRLIGALITTLMGMGITFIILLLIWGIIVVMSKILGVSEVKNKSVKASSVSDTAEALKVQPTPSIANTDYKKDNKSGNDEVSTDIVAVITAAIATFEGNGFKNNLVVKRINRVSGQSTAWRTAGEADCIDSRRI